MLKATGAIGLATILAGCGSPDEEPDEEGPPGEEEGAGEDNESAPGEEEGPGEEEDAWADVEEIVLEGQVEAWIGVEPEPIADEENPTLVLEAGQQYTVTWENADGQGHNFAIVDDQDQVVDDYETEIMDQQGETQELEFEATEGVAGYICQPHQSTMNGEIDVSAGDGDGGGGAGGAGEGENSTDGGAGEGENSTDGGAGEGENSTDGGE